MLRVLRRICLYYNISQSLLVRVLRLIIKEGLVRERRVLLRGKGREQANKEGIEKRLFRQKEQGGNYGEGL